jgi:hypothetical protein
MLWLRRLIVDLSTRVRSQASPCEICGLLSGTGTAYSSTTSIFSFSYIQSVFKCYSCQKDKQANPGNLPKTFRKSGSVRQKNTATLQRVSSSKRSHQLLGGHPASYRKTTGVISSGSSGPGVMLTNHRLQCLC